MKHQTFNVFMSKNGNLKIVSFKLDPNSITQNQEQTFCLDSKINHYIHPWKSMTMAHSENNHDLNYNNNSQLHHSINYTQPLSPQFTFNQHP